MSPRLQKFNEHCLQSINLAAPARLDYSLAIIKIRLMKENSESARKPGVSAFYEVLVAP
ncbi:MAG: hypothetical protein KME32_12905 [Mojavia pulchra JT2-VF2]|uniref:Uncharacterized protein n=1 Tax=Mojavia pulchra JT2-VF2 TaxID=287848 RepID=A0A951PYT5_9NOST|nr:hypothetical protein [Mojavia pulchra JT2-VF2]